jgi:hypothetical protein
MFGDSKLKNTAGALLGVMMCISGTANADEKPSFKYYTIYDKVLEAVRNGTFQGKMCATPSWNIENSGYPNLFKGIAIGEMNQFEAIKQSMTGVCDLVAVRWDIEKYRPQIKKALNWAPHKEISVLDN